MPDFPIWGSSGWTLERYGRMCGMSARSTSAWPTARTGPAPLPAVPWRSVRRGYGGLFEQIGQGGTVKNRAGAVKEVLPAKAGHGGRSHRNPPRRRTGPRRLWPQTPWLPGICGLSIPCRNSSPWRIVLVLRWCSPPRDKRNSLVLPNSLPGIGVS